MQSLVTIIGLAIDIIIFLVIIQLIVSLLIQFDILNRRQPFVMQVYYGINRLLDPVLNPIRRILPSAGGIDFSPMVLIFGLYALQIVLVNNFLR